jgi:Protein of unknown function (DUF2950)
LAALATAFAPASSARVARRAAAFTKTRWHGAASSSAARLAAVGSRVAGSVAAVAFPVAAGSAVAVGGSAAAGAEEVGMNTMATRGALLSLAIMLAAATAPSAESAAPQSTVTTGQTFATADQAVTALVDAARADKLESLRAILGPGSDQLLNSGDRTADAERRHKFVAAYDQRHEIAAADGRMILKVGNDGWSLPIPLVQTDGGWHFDTKAGAQELIDRWIGRNEIAAIRTSLAYVDAQKAFFSFTGQNGEAQYAQRLLSSPGKYNGLYWPAAEGVPESPLEPLIAQAREEGYPVDPSVQGPRPYQGYYFRILTGQGPNTPEGARNYISNGRMTNGFALIAWPASYGVSGIMSFVVDQDGIVFQKDLGPQTATIAAATKLFDPDLTWEKVEVVD